MKVFNYTLIISIILFVSTVIAQEENIMGEGTTNYLPKFTGQYNIGNSNIYVTTGGYVGIGTTTPASRFTVLGSGWNGGALEINSGTGYYGRIVSAADGFLFRNFSSSSIAFSFRNSSDGKLLTVLSSGNVGVGTINPLAKLDVNGTLRTNNTISLISGVTTYINLSSGDSYFNGGGLAIGKTTPSIGYKLDVNGKVRANEIVVNTTGADFVFDDNYRMRTLNEIETFIKENKHLPEIPTAEEMQQSGMNLSEINTKLLQKVEELTLYIIEQEKRIQALENRE